MAECHSALFCKTPGAPACSALYSFQTWPNVAQPKAGQAARAVRQTQNFASGISETCCRRVRWQSVTDRACSKAPRRPVKTTFISAPHRNTHFLKAPSLPLLWWAQRIATAWGCLLLAPNNYVSAQKCHSKTFEPLMCFALSGCSYQACAHC